METQNSSKISATDRSIRLELIAKVHGLTEAENYFMQIPDTASQKASCLSLLKSYVKEKDVEKAEVLMERLGRMGLIVSPYPYNEMMKLYMATSQCNKVPLVILQMKQNEIPRDVLSYNLWMNACAKISGVASVEEVYKEMVSDKNVEVGWSSLSTLANVYIKGGLVSKALLALKRAEEKLSTCNRFGYSFLITLYASLNDKKGVLRLWEASKAVSDRITCTDYMSVLLCLVKLGDLAAARRIFKEWDLSCRNYDTRVSNVLLGAYMRKGLVKEAESLHFHTLKRGGRPNYKTWEILMEGWAKHQNMDKAIDAMEKGLAMLKRCDWRPPSEIILKIFQYFEQNENFEEADRNIRVIHDLGFANLPLYRSLLRMRLSGRKPACDIIEMMEKDKIQKDDETCTLIEALNRTMN